MGERLASEPVPGLTPMKYLMHNYIIPHEEIRNPHPMDACPLPIHILFLLMFNQKNQMQVHYNITQRHVYCYKYEVESKQSTIMLCVFNF